MVSSLLSGQLKSPTKKNCHSKQELNSKINASQEKTIGPITKIILPQVAELQHIKFSWM